MTAPAFGSPEAAAVLAADRVIQQFEALAEADQTGRFRIGEAERPKPIDRWCDTFADAVKDLTDWYPIEGVGAVWNAEGDTLALVWEGAVFTP